MASNEIVYGTTSGSEEVPIQDLPALRTSTPKQAKPCKPNPNSKKSAADRARHAAANSKSRRVKGLCKKVAELLNSERLNFSGILILKDNEMKKVTVYGSTDFVDKFQENEPVVEYVPSKTFTYSLEQLNLQQKEVVQPSPTKMPQQMRSFTPGSRQVFDLQNAALNRGASPLLTLDKAPVSGTSGKKRKLDQNKTTVKAPKAEKRRMNKKKKLEEIRIERDDKPMALHEDISGVEVAIEILDSQDIDLDNLQAVGFEPVIDLAEIQGE